MNYEIQFSRRPRVWCYWAESHHTLKRTKRHVEILRGYHKPLKFRIVRVTRKVVKG